MTNIRNKILKFINRYRNLLSILFLMGILRLLYMLPNIMTYFFNLYFYGDNEFLYKLPLQFQQMIQPIVGRIDGIILLLLLGIFTVSLIIGLISIILYFIKTIKTIGNLKNKATLLIGFYFYNLLFFGLLYMNIQFFTDFDWALRSFSLYRYEPKLIQEVNAGNAQLEYQPAFNGISKKMWQDIDQLANNDMIKNNYYSDILISTIKPTIDEKRNLAKSYEQLVEFLPENKFEIYIDMLLISTSAQTTMSFGNLEPRTKEAKGLVYFQCIIVQFLLVFALVNLSDSFKTNRIRKNRIRKNSRLKKQIKNYRYKFQLKNQRR